MSEDQMLKCLIAFVLGFLVARMVRGNGMTVKGKDEQLIRRRLTLFPCKPKNIIEQAKYPELSKYVDDTFCKFNCKIVSKKPPRSHNESAYEFTPTSCYYKYQPAEGEKSGPTETEVKDKNDACWKLCEHNK